MILVWHKDPKAYGFIEGKRLYGSQTGFPPTDITSKCYLEFKNNAYFKTATYNEVYLSKKYGRAVSPIKFTYDELPFLPMETLDRLARDIGVKPYDFRGKRTSRVLRIRRFLQKDVT